MLNAHLRFGWLSLIRVTEKKTTSVRVRLDRCIAEPPTRQDPIGKLHLLSVIAGDTQMAAISAALSERHNFMIEGPDAAPIQVRLENKKPQSYRASIQVPNQKRAVRHLIAISEELANATNVSRIVLADSSPDFIWSAVAKILGLPGRPEWASWFHDQLVWRNAITPLVGIGCSPVLINARREDLLAWLGDGVGSGVLNLPQENRAIHWPQFGIEHMFQLRQALEPESGPAAASLSVE